MTKDWRRSSQFLEEATASLLNQSSIFQVFTEVRVIERRCLEGAHLLLADSRSSEGRFESMRASSTSRMQA